MPKPRNWWIQRVSTEVFIFVAKENDSQEGELLTHGQRPHRKYSAVKYSEAYAEGVVKVNMNI